MKKYFAEFLIIVLTFTFSAELAFSVENNPLIDAVQRRNIRDVQKYIAQGYNVNAVDASQYRALDYSIKNGDYYITDLLLKNGANPELANAKKTSTYCSGLDSENKSISSLFSNYSDEKCRSKKVAKNTTKKVARSGSVAETASEATVGMGTGVKLAIAGGILVAGGVAAAIIIDGSSSKAGGQVDRDYTKVGDDVTGGQISSILGNSQYTESKNSFDTIRLAYSIARGYTGKIVSGVPLSPYYGGYVSNGIPDPSAGAKVKVAVVDTGVQTEHQDLKDNISTTLAGSNIAFDYCTNTGKCNLTSGGTSLDDPNPGPVANGDNFHGTAVSGIIAAIGTNSLGTIGIASDAEIIPYRIATDDGKIIYDDSGQHLDYNYISNAFIGAANAQATVINNSWGTPTLKSDNTHNIDAGDLKGRSETYLKSILGNDL